MSFLSTLDQFGAEIKAVANRRLPFAKWGAGTNGYGGSANYLPYGLINTGAVSGRGTLDYDVLAGEPLNNSVVAACINAIAQALPDAPIYLERRQGREWKRVDDHPMLDLLRRPNPYHSESDLWGATAAMERTRGQAFWYLEGNRQPEEIWFVESNKVQIQSANDEFISGYLITAETGKPVLFENNQVIHFRHQMNPLAPRAGWAPLASGYRQVAGDNMAATYHSAILHNSGVLSLLISLKDSSAAGEVTPGQIEEFTTKLKAKLFGSGAGGIAGLDLPLDVHKLAYSPDEMALDKLIAYYESRICALMGVDPMVCGLGSGTQQKTYANLSEALNDFWERQIVPMRNRHAATLGAQLLPLFETNPQDWRVRFDYSKVAALQENVDELHARIREDFKVGGIDLWTYQTERGLVPTEDMKGVYYQPPKKEQPMPEQNEPTEAKSLEIRPVPGYEPLTDEELEARATTFSAEEFEASLASQIPAARAILEAKPE